jgi:hypothetical protein
MVTGVVRIVIDSDQQTLWEREMSGDFTTSESKYLNRVTIENILYRLFHLTTSRLHTEYTAPTTTTDVAFASCSIVANS